MAIDHCFLHHNSCNRYYVSRSITQGRENRYNVQGILWNCLCGICYRKPYLFFPGFQYSFLYYPEWNIAADLCSCGSFYRKSEGMT